jgi:Uma2 family endonuclease
MQAVPVQSNDVEQDNPLPSRNHSRVALNLTVILHSMSDRFDVYPQLSLDLNGWRTIPDLALYPKGALARDWLNDEVEVTAPPALVIEILSPQQNMQPLVDKIREYLRHGVKSCWLVEPVTRVVSVFPSSGGSRGFVEGDMKDEPLGISIPLSHIFSTK